MDLSLRNKLLAGLIGAAAIGALVVVGAVVLPAVAQATMASEPVAKILQPLELPSGGSALSTSLAKFDGRYYAIATEPSVSLDPLSSVTVRKIAYGRTTFVTVTTTSSGTYSSDGLVSPHVRYPGVHAEPLQLHAIPMQDAIYGWSKLTGWTPIPLFGANSIGFLDTDAVPASRDGVCVRDTETGACR